MSFLDYRRPQWGARPASYATRLDWSKVNHLILHYPGTSAIVGTDPAAIARRLRGWQDLHMDRRRWSDLAYNLCVDQQGKIWEGRGWDRRDGATKGMGGVSFSILGMIANREQPSDAMKRSILRIFAEANRRSPRAKWGWHSMFASTSCPGLLRDWGRAGFPAPKPAGGATEAARPTPTPAPKPLTPATLRAPDWPLDNGCHSHGVRAYFGPRYPLRNTRSVSGYYTHAADLRQWQRRMRERGWRINPDGLYGDETARVARAFQREKGLTIDGLIGRQTWDAAWTSPIT